MRSEVFSVVATLLCILSNNVKLFTMKIMLDNLNQMERQRVALQNEMESRLHDTRKSVCITNIGMTD